MPLHVHIDPFTGAAGDMLLAALVHAGAPAEGVVSAVRSLRISGVESLDVTFEPRTDHGVSGLGMRVRVRPERQPAHRRASELREVLLSAPLDDAVLRHALRALDLLAGAEASVHGTSADTVRFHELGGVDTLVDLVGVAQALKLLEAEGVSCGPLPLGRVSIRCAHGVLPGPAPATLEILKGVPVEGAPIALETVTPTGAALVRSLCTSFGPAPGMTLRAVGTGFGTTRLPDRPNCLRVWVGDLPSTPRDAVVVLQANVDDLPPEIVATLVDTCLEAGAVDAWIAPVVMKKGRPAHVVSALCPPERADAVERALFVHSSTLGVRRSLWERRCLERSWQTVQTPWGPVRVKVAVLDGEVVNRAPEFEDCLALSRSSGIPLKRIYQEACRTAG